MNDTERNAVDDQTIRVVTVRMPLALHTRLQNVVSRVRAWTGDHKFSMNKLCVPAIEQSVAAYERTPSCQLRPAEEMTNCQSSIPNEATSLNDQEH